MSEVGEQGRREDRLEEKTVTTGQEAGLVFTGAWGWPGEDEVEVEGVMAGQEPCSTVSSASCVWRGRGSHTRSQAFHGHGHSQQGQKDQ